MSHDVFISYSHANKLAANAICHRVEEAGLRCWIAPRDIPHGANWAGAITRAIRECRIFLLVFTDEANDSMEVIKEVGLAAGWRKDIINFRISSAEVNDDLCYHLQNRHWLDAITPPLEQHIESLVERLKLLLSPGEVPVREVERTPRSETAQQALGCPWCAETLEIPADTKVECPHCTCEFWYSLADRDVFWEETPITVICPRCDDEEDGVILIQESKEYQCPACRKYTHFERVEDEARHAVESETVDYEIACPWCAEVLEMPADAMVECPTCTCEFWYNLEDETIYWKETPILVICPKCEDEEDGEILVQESKEYQCPACGEYTAFERVKDEALHDLS